MEKPECTRLATIHYSPHHPRFAGIREWVMSFPATFTKIHFRRSADSPAKQNRRRKPSINNLDAYSRGYSGF